MSRARLVAVGVLVLLLAAAPFIPRGGGDQGSLRPAGDQRYAARTVPSGPGAVSTTMRRTIDQALARDTAGQAAPCAVFEQQQYCVGVGWTDQSQTSLAESLTLGRRQAASASEHTGDLEAPSLTARRAAMPDPRRLTRDRAELEAAAASVAKVVLLRHDILGTPLPTGFLDRHPEARVDLSGRQAVAAAGTTASPSPTSSASPSSEPSSARTKRLKDYPTFRRILDPHHVSQQTRTYYCGPTSMQMITWGWSGTKRSQNHWASRLHTTTSGTGITDMVRVVNEDTGWDKEKYAGPYITLDIRDWSYRQWLLLNVRHIADYHAPVVLHPVLLKKFYPYLDDDASGHFQVGRGYDRRGDGPAHLGYFEPWNQQRFDPSEPFIARVQWRNAYKSYRANEAHFQHNIGV